MNGIGNYNKLPINPLFKKSRALLVALTNVLGKSTVETRDALGRLINVRDSGDGKGTPPGNTSMTYDAFGNLLTTKNPNGNVVSISYDRLGRKTDLQDPDLGWIHYDLDAAGRVWQQISPEQRKKGVSSRFDYDALDRMTVRFEPDLKSYWVYDTAANGIGALAEAYTGLPNAKDYRRELQYDSQGRLILSRQSLYDGSYDSIPQYDGWGRIVRQAYQRNGVTRTYVFRYNEKGHLTRIDRGALPLWELKAQDAAKRPLQAMLGNGLSQTYDYDPNTARLRDETLKLGTALKLAESYQYNLAGQLSSRAHTFDSNLYAETFEYDDLSRLTGSTVAGQSKKINRYDAAGNLLSKTGTGTGDYDYRGQGANAIRPHAVKSIPGIGEFAYDDNGNLTTGAGRTITWNSFDMPKRIAKANGTSSDFVYGTEHQRTRQDRSDGSKIIYAGGQEIEINAQGTTVKTYWPAGLGLEIDKPNGSTELRWSHTDHLGSPTGISNEQGVLAERLSYDPWGKRRTIDGSATPDNLDGLIDNKGYTGHEMLDQLDLVHMNGRVYDPLTARFISADPHVTDPTNGQNYNRYSYVLNDPLGMTDPTGLDRVVVNGGSNTPYGTFITIYGNNGAGTFRFDQMHGSIGNGRGTTTWERTQLGAKSQSKTKATVGSNYIAGLSPSFPLAFGDKEKSSCDPGVQCVEIIGHNPDKKQNSGWSTAIGMTIDWATGNGVAFRHFDSSTSSTQNMMSARRINEARNYFYKKNARALAAGLPLVPLTSYRGDFGLADLFWYAGLNPTQQFVGSYRIDIFPVGQDQIQFHLTNNSSMDSFLYGIGPDWEREKTPAFGNLRQTYSWTEPVKR